LVLTFNQALDPVQAEDVNNYTLQYVGGPHSGQQIPIASATYDPSNNTVTLAPDRLLALRHLYRITANVQGSDFSQVFGDNILSGPSSPQAVNAAAHGVAHQPMFTTWNMATRNFVFRKILHGR
jgi:hypothetical protein